MKSYILTDINGNITNTYKLDGSIFTLPAEYEDITEHVDSDMIMKEPHKYKVSKKNSKHEFTLKVDHEKQKGEHTMDEQTPTDQPVEQTQVPVETPQEAPTNAPIEIPVAQDAAPVVETAPQDAAPSEVPGEVVV